MQMLKDIYNHFRTKRVPTMTTFQTLFKNGATVIRIIDGEKKFWVYGTGELIGDTYELYYYYMNEEYDRVKNVVITPLDTRAFFDLDLVSDWPNAKVRVQHNRDAQDEFILKTICERSFENWLVSSAYVKAWKTWLEKPLYERIPRGHGVKVGSISNRDLFAMSNVADGADYITLYDCKGEMFQMPYAILDSDFWHHHEDSLGYPEYIPLTVPPKRQALHHDDPRRWVVIERVTDHGLDYAVRGRYAGEALLKPTEIFNITIELDGPNLAGRDINLQDMLLLAILRDPSMQELDQFRVYLNNIRIKHAGFDAIFSAWTTRQRDNSEWRNTHPYIFIKDNGRPQVIHDERTVYVRYVNAESVETELD
ncbi:hypothetical protein AVT69_gp257 [Pseudomonas phage PhiPA3]|uniref:Uncharacterized protein 259 n=1 Tax=Pseudomonas phage PhiPA3 TaxID=998086 RepID=F8SJM4_BPPA3|nr:hypothetical protein AVT69_gp257 [Pseudomonas phage PhiPA3]AEH03682.1 hypothetical protein [Pseudomonas phage PhiPA3]